MMYESGVIPEPLGYQDDRRLVEFGIGMTDLVKRPTRGVEEIEREEFAEGRVLLAQKLEELRPRVIAFNGKMAYEKFTGPSLQAGAAERAALRGARVRPAVDERAERRNERGSEEALFQEAGCAVARDEELAQVERFSTIDGGLTGMGATQQATRQLVLEERSGAVLTLRLNRPEKLNALNPDLARALVQALLRAGDDKSVRAVVLTGAGRGFCAGGDIDYIRDARTEAFGARLPGSARAGKEVCLAIASMPKLVIAAVNGPAAGGGMSLALACDLRIASDQAMFKQAFAQLGLYPDLGRDIFSAAARGTVAGVGILLHLGTAVRGRGVPDRDRLPRAFLRISSKKRPGNSPSKLLPGHRSRIAT